MLLGWIAEVQKRLLSLNATTKSTGSDAEGRVHAAPSAYTVVWPFCRLFLRQLSLGDIH